MYFAPSNLKTWLWVCYTSETIGADHVQLFVLVNLFKQKVVSPPKNDLFATVTLHNNLFCHTRSDRLRCTNRPSQFIS